MVEQTKRRGGRPKGSRNKAKPEQVTTNWLSEAANDAQAGRDTAMQMAAKVRELEAELAGNGRDEPAYDEFKREAEEKLKGPPTSPPSPTTMPDLFVHRVENGYIVRPAFPQGDLRTSTDARTWVVADKKALAALVLELIADPVTHPRPIPQPEAFYSPPIIMETATR